jgi:hypothetical protein
MEVDERRLVRLRQLAGKRGFMIIHAPEGHKERARGWRVVRRYEGHWRSHIVVGGPPDGPGATLDEIAAYLDDL